ncbi:MAG: pitrilysin family protein, partial [Rubrivivax sp.]
RTLGMYIPTEQPQRAPAPQRADVAQLMQGFKPQAAADAVAAFDASPANIDARTQTHTLGGLKVALLPKPSRGETVQATLTLRFGDEKNLAGTGYSGDALAQMLAKGSRTLTRQQVQDRLAALKTEMRIGSAPGQVTVILSSRRDFLPEAIALVADLLRNPALPPEALDEFKRQQLTAIERQRKEPGALAAVALAQIGNPYPSGDVRHARSFDEMVQDTEALTLERLRAFHERFYGARTAEFGAVGDMDPAEVMRALQAGFSDWTAGAPYTRVPNPFIVVAPEQRTLATPDKQNADMRVRQFMPITDAEPDYPALMLANHLLGSGGNSRLWRRIRESEGLSYDVRSGIGWSQHEANSPWQASAIFAPGNRAKVQAAFSEEIARALKEGFTEQEMNEGRSGLLSFRRLSRAQDATLASALANNLYLGRTFALSAKVDAALEAMTLQQVNDALRKYLKPQDFVAVFAGDFKP